MRAFFGAADARKRFPSVARKFRIDAYTARTWEKEEGEKRKKKKVNF